MIEGDIRLGFGWAKGFGVIKNVKVESNNLIDLLPDFQIDIKSLDKFDNINLVELEDSEFGFYLQGCVEQLVGKIKNLGGVE